MTNLVGSGVGCGWANCGSAVWCGAAFSIGSVGFDEGLRRCRPVIFAPQQFRADHAHTTLAGSFDNLMSFSPQAICLRVMHISSQEATRSFTPIEALPACPSFICRLGNPAQPRAQPPAPRPRCGIFPLDRQTRHRPLPVHRLSGPSRPRAARSLCCQTSETRARISMHDRNRYPDSLGSIRRRHGDSTRNR